MQKLENQILCGDCLDILRDIDEPFADLVFADPPFNIGYKYDKHHDSLACDSYLSWTRDWMAACRRILKPNGSFYIAIGDKYAANIKIIADELGLRMRNWIIWHYTFGQQMRSKYALAHTHIFYFVHDEKNITFNDFAVRVPSDRQLIYNDIRADARGKMPDDVWNTFSRVCGTFKEREGWHPCQMPENLLARIISLSSNPGDLVFDPFCGSGTTAVAAATLGRRYASTDISEQYVENARRRIAERLASPGQTLASFDPSETFELKRLVSDIGIAGKEIAASDKLCRIVAGQLAIRMNQDKKYDPEQVRIACRSIVY